MAGFLAKLMSMSNLSEDQAAYNASTPLSYTHPSHIMQRAEELAASIGLERIPDLRLMPKLGHTASAIPSKDAIVFGETLLQEPEAITKPALALELAHAVYGNIAEGRTEYKRDMRFAKFMLGDDASIKAALGYFKANEKLLKAGAGERISRSDEERIKSRIELRGVYMSRNEKILDAPIADKEKAEFTAAIAAYNQRHTGQQADKGRSR